ncbi:MAG: translation initiation factor [Acidobacteria bacterium]|jgi:translation initiation factor IF-1|nr:translation initiation factor [Acidobacteriota bacterium]
MPRHEPVRVEGVVVELLPRAMYRVGLDGGRHVLAHLTGSPQRNFVRILVGDRVTVELTPHDLGRGRIVRRVGT